MDPKDIIAKAEKAIPQALQFFEFSKKPSGSNVLQYKSDGSSLEFTGHITTIDDRAGSQWTGVCDKSGVTLTRDFLDSRSNSKDGRSRAKIVLSAEGQVKYTVNDKPQIHMGGMLARVEQIRKLCGGFGIIPQPK